jgi:hypothetical protein
LKGDFQGSRVTSDGGPIPVGELDERLGFGELIAPHPGGSRRGKNTQLPLADPLRQSVYSRIAGCEDVNDAERLSQDPAFRPIGSEKFWDRGAAPTSACRALRRTCWPSSLEQLAATAREDGRAVGEACPFLLADAGGERVGCGWEANQAKEGRGRIGV